MSVRRADFSGAWYPDDRAGCLAAFEQFEGQCVDHSGGGLVGGLVPHAGWTFSGRLAYNTVRELSRHGGEVDTVVLFGGHLGPRSAPAIMTSGRLETPLGDIALDEELSTALATKFSVYAFEARRFPADNTVELQYPIIRHLMPGARLVVIHAPAAEEALVLAVGVVQEAKRLGRRIQVLGSTDLTHYGPNYGWMPHGEGKAAERWVREDNDRSLIQLAEALDERGLLAEALERRNACCPGAAAAAIRCAKLLGSDKGHLLDYATSADVHASDSFVGYTSLVF